MTKPLPPSEPFLVLGTISEDTPSILTGDALFQHTFVLATTGAGKSSFITSLLPQLLAQDIPFYLLDPTGDTADLTISLFAASDFFRDPHERGYDKLRYIDFSRAKHDAAIAYNVLNQEHLSAHDIAQDFLTALHRAFPVISATVGLDTLLLASILALVENSKPATDLSSFLLNSHYRQRVLANVSDPFVSEYFATIFAEKMKSHQIDSSLDALQRRSFLFSFPPELRAILGQRENTLNFFSLMKQKISCIFNLSNLSEVSQRLLACLLLVNIEQAFWARASVPAARRHPVFVFVDEFSLFIDQSETSFTKMLDGVRKYAGTLFLLGQTIAQLNPAIVGSLQNARTILMRLGYEDSKWAAERFFRKQAEQSQSFGEMLFGEPKTKATNPFAHVLTQQDARAIFENLARQQAIITGNGTATLITTNTIPPLSIDPTSLAAIKDRYAQKLYTPLAQMKHHTPVKEEPPGIPLVATQQDALQERKPQRAKRRIS